MFNRFTYKTKFYGTVAIFMLMLLVIFRLNIKKTAILRREYITVKTNIQSGKDTPERLIILQDKLSGLNSMLGSTISHTDLHEKIIKSVLNNPNADLIKIWEFPKNSIYSDGNMDIFTNQLILNGDFKSLVKYLYLLETKEKLSRVRSASFKMKKMRGTINEKLYVEILLQNIEIAQK
jgi:hypothetical protein